MLDLFHKKTLKLIEK